MNNLTPRQILLIVWSVILGVAAAIVTIGNAVEKIAKAKNAAAAPFKALEDRVDKLEDAQKVIENKLGRDFAELKNIQEGNHAIFQALLALLDHGIDGNNIKQMEAAKKSIQDHLIKK